MQIRKDGVTTDQNGNRVIGNNQSLRMMQLLVAFGMVDNQKARGRENKAFYWDLLKEWFHTEEMLQETLQNYFYWLTLIRVLMFRQ